MSGIYIYLFQNEKYMTPLSLSYSLSLSLSESIQINFLTLRSPPGIHVAEHL